MSTGCGRLLRAARHKRGAAASSGSARQRARQLTGRAPLPCDPRTPPSSAAAAGVVAPPAPTSSSARSSPRLSRSYSWLRPLPLCRLRPQCAVLTSPSNPWTHQLLPRHALSFFLHSSHSCSGLSLRQAPPPLFGYAPFLLGLGPQLRPLPKLQFKPGSLGPAWLGLPPDSGPTHFASLHPPSQLPSQPLVPRLQISGC